MGDIPQKPLPAVPPPSKVLRNSVATLTVESKAHLRRFLVNAIHEDDRLQLTEEGDHDGDSWVDVLESALNELSGRIAMGGWLAGVKRARHMRREKARREREEFVEVEQEEEAKDNDEDDEGTAESKLNESPDPTMLALQQLAELAAKKPVPTPRPTPKHLLLTVTPYASGSSALRSRTDDFDVISSRIACLFVSGSFALPPLDDATEDPCGSVLYGLKEWDTETSLEDDSCPRLVGGTFTFKGVSSPTQHDALLTVLRLGTYMQLSLLLEQQFLRDSHVELRFPTNAPSAPPIPSPHPVVASADTAPSPTDRKRKTQSGLWSFLNKRTEDLRIRAANVSPVFGVGKRGSLELPRTSTGSDPPPHPAPPRTFSFLDAARSPFLGGQPDAPPAEDAYAAALRAIAATQDLLSSSPGVVFGAPRVLADMAAKERAAPGRRLRGDEKLALQCLIGWQGGGGGMAGTAGFVRHQSFAALFSTHVPAPASRPSASGSELSVSSAGAGSEAPAYTQCSESRAWLSYYYYARADDETGLSLGETVVEMCARAEERCDKAECEVVRGEHELRWIHDGVRINGRLELDVDRVDEDEDALFVFEGCMECERKTQRNKMSDGTFLLSFGKFLELLVYSPAVCTLHPPLCEHTTPSGDDRLPASRMNITRHFAHRGRVLTFSLSAIDDIFELRVPRLQIVRGAAEKPEPHAEAQEVEANAAKDVLRGEIRGWWQGMRTHMDKLEDQINAEKAGMYKTLPGLPPALCDDKEDEDEDEGTETPRASAMTTDSRNSVASEDSSRTKPLPTEKPLPSVSLDLLSNLRRTFGRAEESLYRQLDETPISTINDVRRNFQAISRGAAKRLGVWQAKHISKRDVDPGKPQIEEPAWWGKQSHAVPGGRVIVREGDWGSIIAFTLSSQDYLRELTNLSLARPGASAPSGPTTPATPASSSRRSYFPSGGPLKLFRASEPQPDPDEEGLVWHEPEACSAVISRKQHPRDPTSLLTLHLRKKPGDEGSRSSSPAPSAMRARVGSGAMPRSAWAKPAVEVSLQAADGEVARVGELAEPGETTKLLHELEAQPESAASTKGSWFTLGSSYANSSAFVETNIRRGRAGSVISSDSESTVNAEEQRASQITVAPPLPPKEEGGKESVISSHAGASETSHGYANTLTGNIANAMKFIMNAGDTFRAHAPPPKNHHGLMNADFSAIDERPHIKYDWTIGKRLKFSCTVYYAKQFDSLRRRCGTEDVFLKSLEKSANWVAEGGKSKSNFWKTSDDRYIIKTLVNAWNVADLQVLIDLGPAYFRYMEKTANRATVLAKLLGFYTVEIRNLETGATQARADLLVMENLFFDQNVVKTFDLKGIQGRKIKARSDGNKTLFDGEWMEGQQRALTLVHPHSKVILREAIKSDCAFLAESNIMDYSLLLGIDEEHKQIACGLVDTIGSYTFAKTLEYKAKQGLAVGAGLAAGGGKDKDREKEVTVIPPEEYQERFVRAMDSYFLASPDKWARPMDGSKEISDPWMLPSVL